MTRLWISGDPLEVETDGRGVPIHLTWRGQVHPVAQVTNQWRLDEGWWFRHVRRDYYRLTTTTGMLLTIYCDLLSGRWYVQRLYD